MLAEAPGGVYIHHAPGGLDPDRPPPENGAVQAKLLALFPLLLLLGCPGGFGDDKPPTPQDAARAAYEAAEETFEAANYLEAVREFQEVRTRHPYSAFAALAELRVADCQFELGKYLEAVESYRSFVRFHPHHDKVAYAEFRIGEAYFKEMPEDWFFMPPAYEKDQASTKDAVRALECFLSAHGDSEYAVQARKRLTLCRTRLANHEMYVARFYLARGKPTAAAGRLEKLAEDFADVPLAADALHLLGTVYLESLDQPAKAGAALRRLVERYPEDERVPAARVVLEELGQSES